MAVKSQQIESISFILILQLYYTHARNENPRRVNERAPFAAAGLFYDLDF